MAYLTEDTKPWWQRAIVIFVVIVAMRIFAPVFGDIFHKLRASTHDYSADYEKRVTNDPNFSALMQPLKEYYPQDYETMKAQAIAAVRDEKDIATIRAVGFNFMREFGKRHLTDLAQTPSPQLAALYDYQTKILKGFQRSSPKLCAHFAMTGLQPGDTPPPEMTAMMSQFGGMRVKFMKQGSISPAGRSTKATDDDWADVASGMLKLGLTRNELKIMAEQKMPQASDEVQCKIGIVMNEAIAALPNVQRERVQAFLLLNSV